MSDRINPVLGAPYGQPDYFDAYRTYGYTSYPNTAAGAAMYYQPRTNPMEEAYRYALRILKDSYSREMSMLYYLDYYGTDDNYYRREHDIQSRYHYERDRLEDSFSRASHQYVLASYRSLNDRYYNSWDYGYNQPYTYKFTYLNSKETTPVMPTETKKYIILDSNDEPSTYFAEGDQNNKFPPFTTLAEAEKEAQELARDNPDEEFIIYQTVKKYKVAGTPLDTTVFV